MLFTLEMVGELTDTSESTLRRWLTDGLIVPSYANEPRVRYGRIFTDDDLLLVSALRALRAKGASSSALRAASAQLRKTLASGVPRDHLELRAAHDNALLVPSGAPSPAGDSQAIVLDLARLWSNVCRRIESREQREGLRGEITRHPSIANGEPIFAGTRVPVADVLALHEAGLSAAEILRQYPSLSEADITAALDQQALALAAAD